MSYLSEYSEHALSAMARSIVKNTSKTSDENGCVLWTGSVDKDGYPRINLSVNQAAGLRRQHRAGRVLMFLAEMEVDDNLMICHRCDTPGCVNLSHLFQGTADDNNKDKARKGRAVRFLGEKHPRAKLTDEQVRDIRASTDDAQSLALTYGVHRNHIYALRAHTFRRDT